jgi:hypothetical protein
MRAVFYQFLAKIFLKNEYIEIMRRAKNFTVAAQRFGKNFSN